MKLFVAGAEEKLDSRLLDGRIQIEGNIIGCFANDITLMRNIKINDKDFITRDGRFYYTLFKSLEEKGFNKIDEVTIQTNSSQRVLDSFDERGGFDTIENLASIINPSNFDGYLDNFFRSNLLCDLSRDGFNLFEPITVKNKKIVPFDLFQKMSSTQIVDFYDMKLSSYNLGQSSQINEKEFLHFEDDWADQLEENPEEGTKYNVFGLDIDGKPIHGFSYLNEQTLGLHSSNLMMTAGFSGVGKSTFFVSLIMALLSKGEKIIVLSNEEKMQKFKVKFMVWLLRNYCKYTNLTKSKLSKGIFNEEDKRQIRLAANHFNKCYADKLLFVSVNENDITLIKKEITDAHLKFGCTAFLLDTFKLSDNKFEGERQDLSMVHDSRELHKLAMKYDMIGMCSCQCGQRFVGALTLTAQALAGSKQTKEILSQLFMMRNLYPEELDPKSRYYCNPYTLVPRTEGKGFESKPISPDPDKTYVVLTLEKNRDGNDTSGNGVSYLFRFDGHFSTFREIGLVKTKHDVMPN